jgi:Colicin-E5 Imm protein
MMEVDRQKVYCNASDFFGSHGNAVMKLSRDAATDLCRYAADHGLVLAKVEGGIFQDGSFEARLDAIWDGADPPITRDDAHKNNLSAASFIQSSDKEYNAFIITSSPLTGWPHRAVSPSIEGKQALIEKA